MPLGLQLEFTPEHYAGFVAIKFAGYTVFGAYLDSVYKKPMSAKPLLFGLTRTILGMALGAAVGLVGLITLQAATTVFIFGLLPFRIAEWYLAIRIFYGKESGFKDGASGQILLGTGCSFLLDVPVIFGYLATGGLWIC